ALRPGIHVDLVGGFTPAMREADDEAVRRARVFVDTRAGATKEAGDIVQPLQSGVLTPERILADLYELTRGERAGRRDADEITLFKSVGAALEDLAAGVAVYEATAR
ncbi:MAG: ornithine cyclodeaminase family protein, partial [Nitratireductor sp.]